MFTYILFNLFSLPICIYLFIDKIVYNFVGAVVEITVPLKPVASLTSVELEYHCMILHCFDFHVVLNFVLTIAQILWQIWILHLLD